MKTNLLPAVNAAFVALQTNPTVANLKDLISQMNSAGASYIHVDGMPKEFATQFIHGYAKAAKKKDLADNIKKAFPKPAGGKKAGKAPQNIEHSNDHSARVNFSTELNIGGVQVSA